MSLLFLLNEKNCDILWIKCCIPGTTYSPVNLTGEHIGQIIFLNFSNSPVAHVGQVTGEHVGRGTGEHIGQVTGEHVGQVTGEHFGRGSCEHVGRGTGEHVGKITVELIG